MHFNACGISKQDRHLSQTRQHTTADVSCRYDKFAFDVTDALEKGRNGTHELAVRVFDPTG